MSQAKKGTSGRTSDKKQGNDVKVGRYEKIVEEYICDRITSIGLWAAIDATVTSAVPAALAAVLRELDELLTWLGTRVRRVICANTRINNWQRVHKLRGAQRIVLMQLIVHSERRGFRKLRSVVELNIDIMAQATDMRDMGGVYVRVHMLTHRMRYIGQTASFQRRDEEHLRAEAKATNG